MTDTHATIAERDPEMTCAPLFLDLFVCTKDPAWGDQDTGLDELEPQLRLKPLRRLGPEGRVILKVHHNLIGIRSQ